MTNTTDREELIKEIKKQKKYVRELMFRDEVDNEGKLHSWLNGELFMLDWVLDLLEKDPPITDEKI